VKRALLGVETWGVMYPDGFLAIAGYGVSADDTLGVALLLVAVAGCLLVCVSRTTTALSSSQRRERNTICIYPLVLK
jgi:hypothetical protein